LTKIVGDRNNFDCVVQMKSNYIGHFLPSEKTYEWPPKDFDFSSLSKE